MDNPFPKEGPADPVVASERAIEKAFADAAFAMFGFGRPRQGVRTQLPFVVPSVELIEIRGALAGARWRRLSGL